MKAINMTTGRAGTIVSAGSIIGLLAYLISVNFHLPFMTADELRYILSSPNEIADYVLISGRYSGLIMIPFAETLSFYNPTYTNLLPRFASILALVVGIILLIRKLGFSMNGAAILAVLIMVLHELDWQHNGLVSFFGIYNVLMATFILALILSEESSANIWIFALVSILLIGSYASEIFIGLSLCYLILKAVTGQNINRIIRSPFFWSLVIYASAYLILRATTTLKQWNAEQMSTYLVGSASVYGPGQMLVAALLYFINSLPYYHRLALPAAVSAVISGILLLSIVGYLIKLWIGIKADGKTNSGMMAGEREWRLAVMIFLFSVSPNFLMALQPMKVDWILRNASVHYVFSYYTWIGLAIVCAYFVKQNKVTVHKIVETKTFRYSAVPILFVAICSSASHNINFARQYDISRSKWLQINEILSQNESKDVVVSPSYLQHPYITAISADQLKVYAKKYYGVRLGICRVDNEIKLNEGINEKIIQLEGLSAAEPEGRWTEGATATINLLEDNPNLNFVELNVTAVFFENKHTFLFITKGTDKYTYLINGVGKYRFDFPSGIDGQFKMQLSISKPISPFTLGLGDDKRNLGIMLKNIRLGFKDVNNIESTHIMKSCY